MKVLYDNQIFSFQRHGGISRYFVELFLGMKKAEAGIKIKLPYIYSDNHYIVKNKLAMLNLSPKEYNFIVKYPRLYDTLTRISYKYIKYNLEKGDYDIFHPTYYFSDFLRFLKHKKPLVLTVYDLIHEKFPKFFEQNDPASNKSFLLRKANVIIAISENTKRDIIDIYNIPEKKIKVVHLASSLSPEETEKINGIPKRYILYVGSRNGYKNFTLFLDSLINILLNDVSLKIICGGGGPFTKEEQEYFNKKEVSFKILQFNVTDKQLAYLYTNALLFIFPSLYEGFGIPALEAFSCGCPVILSNSGSLPEIGGNAAFYFIPGSKESLEEKIKELIYNETKIKELILKGYNRAREFSWDNTVKKTISIYKEIL